MGKHVFVTVGTTRFDSLIEAVDQPAVLSTLASKGFTSLTAQIGHGDHVPLFPVRNQVIRSSGDTTERCTASSTASSRLGGFVYCSGIDLGMVGALAAETRRAVLS